MDHTKKIPHRANKKEIAAWYNVSVPTLTQWLDKIPNLTLPKFSHGGYSREQIIQIFTHIEPPDCFDIKELIQ